MSFKVCILHLVLSEVFLHQSNVWLLHYKWGNMTDQYEEIDMNRCRYQSITQQFLKRCLIKDDNNYVFQPIAVIIRFPSESMVVVLYRIGMVMSQWWDLNICDVCYMLLLRDMGGGICDVRYPGVYSSSMSVHPRIAYNKHHRCWDLTIVT